MNIKRQQTGRHTLLKTSLPYHTADEQGNLYMIKNENQRYHKNY